MSFVLDIWELRILEDSDVDYYSPKMVFAMKLQYAYWIEECVADVFILYMDLFLIYLIFRFTRHDQQHLMNDTVLGRSVPSIVFINNQKLLK